MSESMATQWQGSESIFMVHITTREHGDMGVSLVETAAGDPH